MIRPGKATSPKAWRHPKCWATNPPIPIPRAEPRGIDAFQSPNIFALFSLGKVAESMAVPPGAYPASPVPMAVLAIKSWEKLFKWELTWLMKLKKSVHN